MRAFGPSIVFHYSSTMHPKPHELFSGSETLSGPYGSAHSRVMSPSVRIALGTENSTVMMYRLRHRGPHTLLSVDKNKINRVQTCATFFASEYDCLW